MDFPVEQDVGTADPAMAAEGIVATETPETPEAPKSDLALISEFQNMVIAPQFLLDGFTRMQDDREYVAETCMAPEDEDSVTVNQVLKNQQTVIAHLGIDESAASCKPFPQVGGAIDPGIKTMSETVELFLNRQIRQTRLPEALEGAAQDAQTNGIAWIKVSVQEDFFKDAIGQNRFNDQQENVAEYESLQKRFSDNSFNEDSADYAKMMDLDTTLKVWMADSVVAQPQMIPQQVPVMDPMTGGPAVDPMTGMAMTQTQMLPDPTDPRTVQKQAIINGKVIDLLGCPELPRYLGFSIDQILPDDVRWDWAISRPEEIRKGEWIAYRTYMTQSSIASKFKLGEDDYRQIKVYGSGGSKTERKWGSYSPTDRPNIEQEQINDRCAVWTMEHRVQGTRYVWIDGMKRFLAKDVMQAVGANPFSLFPIYFNRVTGYALPLSDVQLQRDLQDEYNLLRTHDREGRRASYPFNVAAAGSMDEQDLTALTNRIPFQTILLKKPDEVAKYFQQILGAPYNPQLYDTNKVLSDMQLVAGIPLTASGMVGGSDVATDLSLANQGMQKANSRRKQMMNRTLSDILEWMAQVAVKIFPADNIKAQCGMNSVWLAMSAEQLSMNFQIEVKGAVDGAPDFKSQMQFWTSLPGIIQQLSMTPGLNVPLILSKLMQLGGIRENIGEIYQPPMMMPGMGAPGGEIPGGPGSPQGQGPQGSQGGAPPQQSAPSPNNLPNNPQARMAHGM